MTTNLFVLASKTDEDAVTVLGAALVTDKVTPLRSVRLKYRYLVAVDGTAQLDSV